jgi:hypothetical protein
VGYLYVRKREQIKKKDEDFPTLPKECQISTLPLKPGCGDSIKLIQKPWSAI